eukprot:9310016-Karenia_brevis.AAC.1
MSIAVCRVVRESIFPPHTRAALSAVCSNRRASFPTQYHVRPFMQCLIGLDNNSIRISPPSLSDACDPII